MKRRALIFILALPSLGMHVSAQDVISPPPNSASHVKMVDHAVDLHTGVPGITIPLHTIEGRKLSYPISISYNASGIKVAEVAGAVGLGWSLNAEGMITRAVRGRPDEFVNSYFQFAGSVPHEADPIADTTLFKLADGHFDMQPDLFYYNTGWDAGKFLFDNQLVAQTIPKKPLKISFDDMSTLSNAVITTYDGTRFIFINGETSALTGWPSSYKSSWYLSRIVSADNADTIRFNYSVVTSSSYDVIKSGFMHFFYNVPSGVQTSKAQYEVNNSFGTKTVSLTGTKYLESIQTSREKVVFEFGSRIDKTDLKKLDALRIYSKDPLSGEFVERKRINFSYSYFLDTEEDPTRLRLDSLQEVALPSVATRPPYRFVYSPDPLPPPVSAAQDAWGYYNGATSNNSLVPATTFQGQVISTSDRGIHAEFVDACTISKVISPLGAVTEYFFQPNTYGAGNSYGPGHRVYKIVEKDAYSNIHSITNYEYVNPSTGSSSGVLMESPSFTQHYLEVVEVVHGDTVNYDCMLIPINPTGAGTFSNTPVLYEYVTVYNGDNYNVAGKTTYQFTLASAPAQSFPYFPTPDNSWSAGQIGEIEHYKVENGIPTIVRHTANIPIQHSTFTTIKGLNAGWGKIYILYDPEASNVIRKNFIQESKFAYISETTVYTYEQDNPVAYSINTQNFYYDRTDGYYLPNRITTTTSESDVTLAKEYTYPVDYPASGVFGAMQNAFMVSLPVEAKAKKIVGSDVYVTDYQKTDYYEWSPLRIYPQHVYRGKFSGAVPESAFLADPSSYLQRAATINAYHETGLPLETQPESGIPSAIIVDKAHAASVAAVANAKADQVAFTSFESFDHGNWTVNAGSEQRTKSKGLSSNGSDTSLPLEFAQTVTYTYSVTQTTGPRPLVTFSKAGESDIEVFLNASSGSGSVSLSAGTWTATLTFDTNVSSVSFTMTYAYLYYLSLNVVDTDAKTGTHSMSLTSSHSISKTGLGAGDYVVSYYQKGGSVTFSVTGSASVLGTETAPAGTDGWEHIKKTIRVASSTDTVQITGDNIKVDEARLYPSGAVMQTTCYDAQGLVNTRTDHNMRSQFYEYDEWGQPTVVRDQDRNILSYQQYKLAGN